MKLRDDCELDYVGLKKQAFQASKTAMGNAMHAGSAVSLMQAILTSVSWHPVVEVDGLLAQGNSVGRAARCCNW